MNTLRTAIRSSLLDVGKGWFNMEERNWEVYKISKLAKFMQLVKFAMQVRWLKCNLLREEIFLYNFRILKLFRELDKQTT